MPKNSFRFCGSFLVGVNLADAVPATRWLSRLLCPIHHVYALLQEGGLPPAPIVIRAYFHALAVFKLAHLSFLLELPFIRVIGHAYLFANLVLKILEYPFEVAFEIHVLVPFVERVRPPVGDAAALDPWPVGGVVVCH